MVVPAKPLRDVFGVGEIGDRVAGFDFSKMSVRDDTRDDYLHVDLAPSYGSLNSQSIKTMDKNLKIIIAGTVRTLQRMPPGNRNWNGVVAAMMQNPLLEPDGPDQVHRVDQFIKNSSHDFKFDGSPDAAIVREVSQWFSNLINDSDVLAVTRIDINVLARIVAQTGATVDSFESFFAKNEHHQKTMVDIGVMRFPDITHPYFKLTAWSDSTRILFHSEDRNGINGEFNSRRFRPRPEVIAAMRQEVQAEAVKEAEALFT